MNRIHLLSPYVANQIAAGEVIERPASVLKELLENSLDAGSTQIEVLIKGGGMRLIQVQDNGCGICKEDLALALAQHATSKIITSEDLEGVLSLGFRGEALASIAAVSKLSLSAKTKDAEHGWCIEREGRGTEGILTPIAHPMGTRLEIRDLFYNTPARRKFLKSEKTEWGHVQEMFKRIALSRPEVAFSLTEGDRVLKRLPACLNNIEMHAKRIALLCGEAFIDNAFYIEAENNGLRLKGWLGTPGSTRPQADLQYFYVNGRIVRDKVVTHAVRQAHQHCPPGRYPAYVLYFECDPTTVDVNVHPTKHEVRFREARTTHAFLSYSIREGLEKGESGPLSLVVTPKEVSVHPPISFDEIKSVVKKNKTIPSQGPGEHARPLSVLKGEFLLAENPEGLWIADIKAIRCQAMLKALQDAYDNHTCVTRPLLIPKTVLVGERIAQYELNLCDWTRLGFALDQIGPEQLLVRSVPALLGSEIKNLEQLIIVLLDATEVNDLLKKIANHAVNDVSFSTEDALRMLKNAPWEQYGKLYRQISVETLREILYRDRETV